MKKIRNRGSLNLEMALLIMLLVLSVVFGLTWMGGGIATTFENAADFLTGGNSSGSAEDTMDYWLGLSDDSTRLLEQCGTDGTPYIEKLPDNTVRVVFSPAMVELLENYNIGLTINAQGPGAAVPIYVDAVWGKEGSSGYDNYLIDTTPFLSDSQYVIGIELYDSDWNEVENKYLGIVPLKDNPTETIVNTKVNTSISTPLVFWGGNGDDWTDKQATIGNIDINGDYSIIDSFRTNLYDPVVDPTGLESGWNAMYDKYNYGTNEYYNNPIGIGDAPISRHDADSGVILGNIDINGFLYEVFNDYYCTISKIDDILYKYNKNTNAEMDSILIPDNELTNPDGPPEIKLSGNRLVLFRQNSILRPLRFYLIDMDSMNIITTYDTPVDFYGYFAGKTTDGGFIFCSALDYIFYQFDSNGNLIRTFDFDQVNALSKMILDGDILYIWGTGGATLKIYDISGVDPVLIQENKIFHNNSARMNVYEFLN